MCLFHRVFFHLLISVLCLFFLRISIQCVTLLLQTLVQRAPVTHKYTIITIMVSKIKITITIKSITQIIGIFITDIDAFCVNSSTRLSRLSQIMTNQTLAGLKIFATFLRTSLIKSSKNMHCIGFLWTFSGRKSDLCLLEDKFVWITPIEFQWLLVGSRYETEEISFPFSFSVCQIFCVKKENMFSFCVRKISVERRSRESRRSQSTLLAAMM